MKPEEIIEMARQAGFLINELHCSPPILSFSGQENSMEIFAKLVAAKEREACAKTADEWNYFPVAHDIAAAIRARGTKA